MCLSKYVEENGVDQFIYTLYVYLPSQNYIENLSKAENPIAEK